MKKQMPIVGIPADRRIIGPHAFSAVGEKYILAVSRAAEAMPVLLPVTPDQFDIDQILEHLDGLLFTGSPSNVEPHHYGGAASESGTMHDPERDALTLPLIRAAVEQGVPLLGLCRGFQEINVALGGTLHQRVHEISGHRDHREDQKQSLEEQYGPAHDVLLESGGVLRKIAGTERIRVNSLHSQGVDRLADGLQIEARAEDGLIEAFSIKRATTFAIAVQWHPEWQVLDNAFSRALFKHFGEACGHHRSKKI